MRKTLSIVFAGIFTVSLCATPVIGQGVQALESLLAGSSGGDGPGSLLPLMIKGVGLTNEQTKQVRNLLATRRKTLRSLFKQLRTANEELANQLFVPEDVNEDTLKPTVQEITRLREQLLLEGVQTVLAVRQILTPEQRVKAARLKEHVEALHAAMSGLMSEKEMGETP
jgi:Spy/CpxP family protein refolding chaperone